MVLHHNYHNNVNFYRIWPLFTTNINNNIIYQIVSLNGAAVFLYRRTQNGTAKRRSPPTLRSRTFLGGSNLKPVGPYLQIYSQQVLPGVLHNLSKNFNSCFVFVNFGQKPCFKPKSLKPQTLRNHFLIIKQFKQHCASNEPIPSEIRQE